MSYDIDWIMVSHARQIASAYERLHNAHAFNEAVIVITVPDGTLEIWKRPALVLHFARRGMPASERLIRPPNLGCATVVILVRRPNIPALTPTGEWLQVGITEIASDDVAKFAAASGLQVS